MRSVRTQQQRQIEELRAHEVHLRLCHCDRHVLDLQRAIIEGVGWSDDLRRYAAEGQIGGCPCYTGIFARAIWSQPKEETQGASTRG